jgi:hypothetical protein
VTTLAPGSAAVVAHSLPDCCTRALASGKAATGHVRRNLVLEALVGELARNIDAGLPAPPPPPPPEAPPASAPPPPDSDDSPSDASCWSRSSSSHAEDAISGSDREWPAEVKAFSSKGVLPL